ncbi:BZ3500_MvSof-1268-A1-R1_Chr8-1g09822 [Microbotryum saponariae]|uniref:BZ3500_MvSof-1268-A1-R1_Chr8-1g09822 protein n=1 Tax=Microbotryum saponariae TaxID=289078 RepID=A0A2X0MUQ7_9BASI|nr:BZ3500_MvSof-1268-A1-R1_Chr8-1g09822 [Microbotryum saponariae]SDA08108.1 BZ3501_MvSof-1269-A2-R1_Chr8-1g09545 [Microbotryum saponariae]
MSREGVHVAYRGSPIFGKLAPGSRNPSSVPMQASHSSPANLTSPSHDAFRSPIPPSRSTWAMGVHGSTTSSSSPASLFRCDAGSSSPYASSYSTVASSPMTKSSSLQLSAEMHGSSMSSSPSYDMMLEDQQHTRPELQRRLTAPAANCASDSPSRSGSPAGVVRRPPIPKLRFDPATEVKRGVAKQSDDASIWPKEIDEAFRNAYFNLPELGRRKVLVDGKPAGRNELIALYILDRCHQERTRKQISSHIQVIKNAIIAQGQTQTFEPQRKMLTDAEARYWFPTHQIQCLDGASPEPMPGVDYQPRVALYPNFPVSVPPKTMRPMAMTPMMPQTAYPMTHIAGHHAPYYPSAPSSYGPMPLTPTTTLTHAISNLGLLSEPSPASRYAGTVMLESLCFWVSNGKPNGTEVMAKLDTADAATSSQRVSFIESLPPATISYDRLISMYDKYQCPFIHAKLNVTIPDEDYSGRPLPTNFHSSYVLSSTQELDISVVTSMYIAGELQRVEKTSLIERVSVGSPASGSDVSSPASAASPEDRDASRSSQRNANGKIEYNVPFGDKFWSWLFAKEAEIYDDSHQIVPTLIFTKNKKELEPFANIAEAVLVVQEFSVHDAAMASSNGEVQSEVVLVVAHTVHLHDPAWPGRAFSVLSTLIRNQPAPLPGMPAAVSMPMPMPMQMPMSMPMPVPSPAERMPLGMIQNLPRQPTRTGPSSSSFGHRRGNSVNKPNLSLQIPPLPNFSFQQAQGQGGTTAAMGGLHTPLTQIVHTPMDPPPFISGPPPPPHARAQRSYSQSSISPWDCTSPAFADPYSAEQGAGMPFFGEHDDHLSTSVQGHLNGAPIMAGAPMFHQMSTMHPTSRAMIDKLTAEALAAGTPTIEHFPGMIGTPITLHPTMNRVAGTNNARHPVKVVVSSTPIGSPLISTHTPVRTPAPVVSSPAEEATAPKSASKVLASHEERDFFSGLLGESRYA